jgi:chromosome segregation ATPase
MDFAQLLPFLFGGGGLTLLLAALAWGRKDARDAVETSEKNVQIASDLRDNAIERATALEAKNTALEAELSEFRRKLNEAQDLINRLRDRLRDAGADWH